jgi:hypothetical protein
MDRERIPAAEQGSLDHCIHSTGSTTTARSKGGVAGGGYGNVAPSPGGGASEPSTRPPSS